MNAAPHQAHFGNFAESFAEAVRPENSPASGKRRLNDAVAIYSNDDAQAWDWAFDAFCNGRASFWTIACYHNQSACNMLNAINLGTSIAEARARYFGRPGDKPEDALGTLVPLNRAAARALSLAYSEAGLWRDDDELLMRGVKDFRRSRILPTDTGA